MKTVKEIFSKAFGEVPEGAYISHIAGFTRDCEHCEYGHWEHKPIFEFNGLHYVWQEPRYTGLNFLIPGYWYEDPNWTVIFTQPGNIANRDANHFRGFFGAEYDNALDAEGEK